MRGDSDEAAMAAAAEHGRSVHGMTDADFTDENVAIIRSHLKDV
jgi:predicted small metal-binding protein